MSIFYLVSMWLQNIFIPFSHKLSMKSLKVSTCKVEKTPIILESKYKYDLWVKICRLNSEFYGVAMGTRHPQIWGLNSKFFKMDQCQPQPNRETQPCLNVLTFKYTISITVQIHRVQVRRRVKNLGVPFCARVNWSVKIWGCHGNLGSYRLGVAAFWKECRIKLHELHDLYRIERFRENDVFVSAIIYQMWFSRGIFILKICLDSVRLHQCDTDCTALDHSWQLSKRLQKDNRHKQLFIADKGWLAKKGFDFKNKGPSTFIEIQKSWQIFALWNILP